MSTSRYNSVGVILGAVILAVASGTAGYLFARRSGQAALNSTPMASMPSQGREPLYWYDPMQPNQHFDKPGKSPFMDMQLVPKYPDEAEVGGAGSIRIDPSIVQNLGVRTTEVERGALSRPVEAVGTLGFNQRDIAVLQARSNGFVAKTYARAPGDVIGREAAIVDLLVPEWAGAQTEFLALLKTGDRELIDAARQRLLLLGMSSELIRQVEEGRAPRTTVTVRSPLAGMIESLDAREGMTISTGVTIAKINGLSTVWLEAAIPEAQGALAQLGKSVEVHLTAYPGQRFKGRVIAVLPQANVETHTVRARIELGNADGRLKPGMFAQVRLNEDSQVPVLYVASEAVIRTGTRTVVIVSDDQGRFTPTEVQTGADLDGKTVVIRGLTEGQRVVASGQFLIDSEASLKGVLARLSTKPGSSQ
jgi:membrane fusion protein, copper/silver efflux system